MLEAAAAGAIAPAASAPLRVLCLDIEGAHGGSSRSLYELLRCVDRSLVEPEVIARRPGKVEEWYRDAGIRCRVLPDLPKVSSLPRLSRNLVAYGQVARAFWQARATIDALAADINRRFDVVHFNHEAWFLLARTLRRRTRAALSMHIRTRLEDSVFARWQARTIAATCDHLVFITENERDRMEALGGRAPGTVIFNPAQEVDTRVPPHPAIPTDRFVVAALSNYSWVRGIDRLVDVAVALKQFAPGNRILFAVAGDMKLGGSLPGTLGDIGRKGGTLADYALERGVSDAFLFLGHVGEPERVLAGCSVLARPTREANPWGRDTIEGLAAGRPVFAVGTWQTFVTSGVTGFIEPEFDAQSWARELLRLAADPSAVAAMSAAARERARTLCSGPDRAADLVGVWRRLAERPHSP